MSEGIDRIFIEVLNMSLTGCVVILAVILARLLLRRAPRIFSYVLWAVVLFRLLCPVSFSSQLSLLGFLQNEPAQGGRMAYIPEGIGIAEQPEITLPDGIPADGLDASLPGGMVSASANPVQIILHVGALIWILGVFVMLGYSAYSLLCLGNRLKSAVWERENIYRIPGTGTPFVYGLFRPRIYYPCSLDGEEKDYILVHEHIHIRRCDHITRMLGYLTLCVHWFNPLVWAAYVLSGRDMEMSCDEAVLRQMGNAVKKEYSASLLALASGGKYSKRVPLAFGERDTGNRIKNVLRYQKPRVFAAGIVAVFCAGVAVFLLANPAAEPIVFYGIVETIDFDGNEQMVIWVPGIGEMDEPGVKDVIDSDPKTFSGLLPGWLVRITFPAGEEVEILETWPGRFSTRAESIDVVGMGFAAETTEGGRCRVALPMDFTVTGSDGTAVQRLEPEDTLIFSDTNGGHLAQAQVVPVDSGLGQVWIELTQDEAKLLFEAYEGGFQCEVVRGDERAASIDTEATENTSQADTGSGAVTESTGQMNAAILEDSGQEADGGVVLPLSPEYVVDGRVVDGIYRVYVRSISRSLRGIDLFVAEGWEEDMDLPELAFDENCTFWVNVEMDSVRYEERGFDEFADLVGEAYPYLNPPLRLIFEDGLIEEAYLDSAYYGEGIAYAPVPPAMWYPDLEQITGETMEDILAKYYVPARTVQADVSDAEGMETIEVYTGSIGDGDSGIVRILSEDGTVLYGDGAHASRALWSNIYLGERDGVPFLMIMHIEDRELYGEYAYYVFRLDESGEVRQIAGTTFTFGGEIGYDDEMFREWAGRLMDYLADSRLLLSSQEMELRTEPVSEADKYNYGTLRRNVQ